MDKVELPSFNPIIVSIRIGFPPIGMLIEKNYLAIVKPNKTFWALKTNVILVA